MTAKTPLPGSEVPTLIEVWAPHCSQCRAMKPDLEAVASEFKGRVDLHPIEASSDGTVSAELGVFATPTLIGIVDGTEVYRSTGRASQSELRGVFAALEARATPVAHTRRSDVILRTGTGAVLAAVGALAGPSIPLVVIGVAIASWGLLPLVRKVVDAARS